MSHYDKVYMSVDFQDMTFKEYSNFRFVELNGKKFKVISVNVHFADGIVITTDIGEEALNKEIIASDFSKEATLIDDAISYFMEDDEMIYDAIESIYEDDGKVMFNCNLK